MKNADLLLNLSTAESFSFVVAEAMSYGVPIIATNSGGPEELIVDGESGIILPNRSTEELAISIITIMDNYDKRQLISSNSKLKIRYLINRFNYG